jgi:hypothetical protein
MLRQAQERKIKGQQAAAVDTRAAETRVRAAEAKAKVKVAREEAEERAARVRSLAPFCCVVLCWASPIPGAGRFAVLLHVA